MEAPLTHQLFIPAPLNRHRSPDWINANQRDHWAVRSRKTRAWRNTTHWLAKAAKLPQELSHVSITGHVVKTNRARYDAHNLMPTLKAIVDGLVDYGLIPDDHNTHLTGPDIREGGTGEQPGIMLEIRET